MTSTTVKVNPETKHRLDEFKEYKRETYDEVIRKLFYIADNIKENPELSQESIIKIEEARKRIKKGKFITEEEARRRLGF